MSNLSLTIELLHYVGAAQVNPADASSIKNRVQDANIKTFIRNQLQLAASATDQVVPLADSSADYLAILTDRQVSVKLNGSSTAIVLNPIAVGTKSIVLVLAGVNTALTITNPSSTNVANVDIISLNK